MCTTIDSGKCNPIGVLNHYAKIICSSEHKLVTFILRVYCFVISM